jgi:murein L,D-transpeptidase YafK
MIRTILFFSLLLGFSSVMAEDMVEVYRLHGMEGLEKKLDRELTKPAYWKGALSRHDIRYGYFDRLTELLVCDKSKKELFLYAANGHFVLKQKSPIIIGKTQGDKHEEGDYKTPIGVYHIVARKEQLEEKYGPLALVTDYPNRFDRIWGKDGHGIWLHGLPPDCSDKNATKGCIAVDNSSLIALDKKLSSIDNALLIISPAPLPPVSREKLARLLAFIYDWRYAWKYNRYQDYIEKYSTDLVFQKSHDYRYFLHYKEQVFKNNANRKKRLDFTDLKIVPYPNSQGKKLWYLSFHEFYKSGGYQFSGDKEILIEETPSERFLITME